MRKIEEREKKEKKDGDDGGSEANGDGDGVSNGVSTEQAVK